MKYYKVTDDPAGIPILWKDLPNEIKENISGDLIWNIKVANNLGVLEEKSIIYVLEQPNEDPDDLNYYYAYGKINDNVTVILDFDDIW